MSNNFEKRPRNPTNAWVAVFHTNLWNLTSLIDGRMGKFYVTSTNQVPNRQQANPNLHCSTVWKASSKIWHCQSIIHFLWTKHSKTSANNTYQSYVVSRTVTGGLGGRGNLIIFWNIIKHSQHNNLYLCRFIYVCVLKIKATF